MASNRIRLTDPERPEAELRFGADFAVKHQIFRNDRMAVAAQVGPAYLDSPDDRCAGWGADARISVGRGFGDRGFVNAEIGRREAQRTCAETMAELTFGLKPARDRLRLVQMAYHESFRGESALTVQVSTVRLPSPGRAGRQFGIRVKSTRSDEIEVYLVNAIWRRGRP